MITPQTFEQLALSHNGVEQLPHFNRTAFKITGRKIFATLLEEEGTANILLSPADQDVYCAFNKVAVYPIPNKWGLQGWTTFSLKSLPVELVSDALLSAYNNVLQNTPVRKKRR